MANGSHIVTPMRPARPGASGPSTVAKFWGDEAPENMDCWAAQCEFRNAAVL
ncbi:hypothetical protein GGTG_10408 [Gaeumannomyces tritici R3-111a-1]|uniref:Uncharacterized protein n=1 Tax=Gaeumannomyces tritici (strain R3-111a-1) TaxID=644352 RepID=J3PA82_GAET3|nr:hypothetical protein GGTG_10408 [Gaeumannomyces tritici R3-111a-1]EJT71148.1 hypothetical protein GGTG_10408 [Gaeumannomyces tritici R3-111a-1]